MIKIVPLIETLRLEKIDDQEYFSEKYSGYISNSRLSLINPTQGGSPEKFFEGKFNIYSDSLNVGSAVHELCLQKEAFHLCFDAERPTSKAGAMADELYKEFINDNLTNEVIINASDKIDYYKGKMDKKKIDTLLEKCTSYWKQRQEYELHRKLSGTPIYLDSKNREKVQQCVSAINRNITIQNLLHPKGLIEDPISENEQAILLDVQIEMPNDTFTLRLKSKLDNYTIDQESGIITVNDIKTMGKILSEFDCKGGSIDKYHYRRELGEL